MATSDYLKATTKRAIKKGLITTKRIAGKSKTLKKAAKTTHNILFPGYGVNSNIYDYSRYAPTIAEYQKQLKAQKAFKHRPLISVVMPTYNTNISYLKECIESVTIQSYDNWELCIADDASPDKEVVKTIREYIKLDKRIKLVAREKNGHISEATNSAIELANGEYIALLDHDDLLWPNAIFEIVKVINEDTEVDLIYTDEDKIDEDGKIHSYPFLKPDFSPEFLESCNYITHFSCIRASIVQEVGGLRKGYEGAQDWDLLLRVSEITNNIVHIPKILYSWRIHEASTASDTDAKPYVYEAQRRLLVDHITRSGQKGAVKQGVIKQHSSIDYEIIGSPKISIVIHGNDKRSEKHCLKAIAKNNTYKNTELIITQKGHSSASALNHGVQQAKGQYLIFINSHIPPNTKNFIQLLLGDAQREGIGIVGGKTVSRGGDKFLRAAAGLGIHGLYAHFLEWMPVDDVHYMRGLYGQSRRNVLAIDSGCSIIKKEKFIKAGGFDEGIDDMYMIDLCLKLYKAGNRNIYNPFIASTDSVNLTAGDAAKTRDPEAIKQFQYRWKDYINDDPYFNPAFTRTNAQLELK